MGNKKWKDARRTLSPEAEERIRQRKEEILSKMDKGDAMTGKRFDAINTTIEVLRRAWLTHPELRLGQLIRNATRDWEEGEPDKACTKLFYIPDWELRAAIILFCKREEKQS